MDIVGPDPLQFRASSEDEALAFHQLLTFATEHADDFGYPRSAADHKSFELAIATNKGAALLNDVATNQLASGFSVSSVPARASIRQVTDLANEIIDFGRDGVAGGELIWKTEPDQINNRVIVTVYKRDSGLFATLAERYGDLIAVRIEDAGFADSHVNRDSDAPAFWGGAYWASSTGKGCSTGFAWSTGSGSAMITAAHCISTGGTASYPNYPNAGTVASASEENWQDTVGTRYYTGQSTYRGDVALIRYSGYGSAPYIYNGIPGTSTHTAVAR